MAPIPKVFPRVVMRRALALLLVFVVPGTALAEATSDSGGIPD